MSHRVNARPRVLLLVVLGVATACQSVAEPRSPACLVPAPLSGSPATATDRYIVTFRDGVNAAAETARLSAKYGFTPLHIYETVLSGFNAELTPAAVAAVRCESSVRSMSHDEPGTIP